MKVIDSHTEGEPTRVVVDGGPNLGGGPLSERLQRFREQADHFRKFAINEPRAFDAVVGAILCEPEDRSCATGVIFFNNTGYLGMCGHGTIGVAVTLNHLGRIGRGKHRIETPVGVVSVELTGPNRATIENVPSYRYRKAAGVKVDGFGEIVGDVAWGGNWFFLVHSPPMPIAPKNIDALVDLSRRIRDAISEQGITGKDGAYIDHIEISDDSFGQAGSEVDSRNFVLCPGGVYDRSPCGTGTSAKLACLAADGKLNPGVLWTQESIVGGRFSAEYSVPNFENDPGEVIAKISGNAFICGETNLVGQQDDPFGYGLVTGGNS